MQNPLFDTVIDRTTTDSIKWQKFDKNVIPMWVADMEFPTPRVVTDALQKRIEHPILGYTSAPESLADCVAGYCKERHGWTINTDYLHWVPGVLPAVTAACQICGDPGDEIIVFPILNFCRNRSPTKRPPYCCRARITRWELCLVNSSCINSQQSVLKIKYC